MTHLLTLNSVVQLSNVSSWLTMDDEADEASPLVYTHRDGSPATGRWGGLTVRGIAAGILIGIPLCISNMYFGLQTGFSMSTTIQAALLGFGIFKAFTRYLSYPFTPHENVLIQTIASATASMPIAAGYISVIPSLQYLTTAEERGMLRLSWQRLLIWSLGICCFGPLFAMLLRNHFIVKEKLRFPTGTATASLISVLHDQHTVENQDGINTDPQEALLGPVDQSDGSAEIVGKVNKWKHDANLLIWAFGASAMFVGYSVVLQAVGN